MLLCHAPGIFPELVFRHSALVAVVAAIAGKAPVQQVHVHDPPAAPLEDAKVVLVVQDVLGVELQLQGAVPSHHACVLQRAPLAVRERLLAWLERVLAAVAVLRNALLVLLEDARQVIPLVDRRGECDEMRRDAPTLLHLAAVSRVRLHRGLQPGQHSRTLSEELFCTPWLRIIGWAWVWSWHRGSCLRGLGRCGRVWRKLLRHA